MTTPAMPYAERVLVVSCAAISAVPVKTQPHRVSPTPERERVGGRQAVGDQAGGDQGAEHQVGEQRDEHRSRRRGVPADRRGPEQLVAAGLLLAAGVPADDEHAHQPDEDRAERRRLPRDLAADGVRAPAPGRPSR